MIPRSLLRVASFFVALVFILSSRPIAADSRPFIGAGILPYAEHNGRIYVLLGYDPGRGWTSFGGAPMKVSSLSAAHSRWESKVETALREGFEECRMVVPMDELKAGLDPERYFPRSRNTRAFRTFTVKIRYRAETVFANQAVTVGSGASEKKGYCWIPLDELRSIVVGGGRKLGHAPAHKELWSVFYHGLKKLFNRKDYKDYFP